jgi:hypothetical protein
MARCAVPILRELPGTVCGAEEGDVVGAAVIVSTFDFTRFLAFIIWSAGVFAGGVWLVTGVCARDKPENHNEQNRKAWDNRVILFQFIYADPPTLSVDDGRSPAATHFGVSRVKEFHRINAL